MTPTMEEVVTAYLDCRKGKRNTPGAIAFESKLVRNLSRLWDELVTGEYEIGASHCFVVLHPRPREIWAAEFRDRIVHHVVYNRIAPALHASFSAASCACIPGRGTLYGAKRLEKQIRGATQNWSKRVFYLKLDLANFFVSIYKPIVFELLTPKLRDQWTFDITRKILFHDPRDNVVIASPPAVMRLVPEHKSLFHAGKDYGLPIGNLPSQLDANVLLNPLDQYVGHRLKPLGYVRYVDDFILLHESSAWLIEAKEQIEAFLHERLQLRINPSKTVLQPVERGVDFVGQVIKPWRRVARNTLLPAAQRRINLEDDPVARRSSANSYLGLLRQCSAYRERASICRSMMRHGHPVDTKLTRVFAQSGGLQCDI